MAGIARPFIPWIGSKEKLIPYIWQVFPPTPKLYLEPFGGGGALLLGMQPKVSRMDIYNDFNCDLVNLFLCARGKERRPQGRRAAPLAGILLSPFCFLWWGNCRSRRENEAFRLKTAQKRIASFFLSRLSAERGLFLWNKM